MISVFRRHLQGPLLRYTIYAVSALVALPMVASLALRFFDQGQWAIKVNGVTVTPHQYQQQVDEMRQQLERMRRMFGPMADKLLGARGDIEKMVIDGLISQKLMEQVATSQYILVAPDFVKQQFMAQIPKELRLPDGSIDAAHFARLMGKSPAQAERELAEQVQHQILLTLADGAVYVPQFQLKQAYMAQHADRSLTVATFARGAFGRRAAPSDAQLQSFFDAENRTSKRYWEPERRSAIVWEFDASGYGMPINETLVKNYYNRRKYEEFVETPMQLQVRHIVFAPQARAQAESVRQELLKNPGLFAQKAKEVSADPDGKKNGGLLPFFSHGAHDEAFEKAAYALTSDGMISPIVQTKKGLEIIQRVGRKAQTYKPEEKVRDTILKKLRSDRFGQLFAFDVKRAVNRRDQEPGADVTAGLEELARKHGGKKRVVTDLEQADAKAAYEQKVFNVGKGYGASVVDGARGYAILVTEIKKPARPTLNEIKSRVTADWYAAQAAQELQVILADGQKKRDLAGFEAFVRSHGGTISSTGMINVGDKTKTEALRKQLGDVFDAAQRLSVPGAIVGHLTDKTAYLVRLDTIAPFNAAQFEARKAALAQELWQTQKGLFERAFIASLYKHATIKINDTLVQMARA